MEVFYRVYHGFNGQLLWFTMVYYGLMEVHMGVLWVYYGFTMGLIWFTMGLIWFTMGSLWSYYGLNMGETYGRKPFKYGGFRLRFIIV